MTKTYSEQRQTILFRAARELRAVAAEILNDCGELDSAANLEWAKQLAAKTATRANELENEGHEQCGTSNRAETEIRKSRDKYSDAVTRHMALAAKYS